jgi:hypothetical protein
MFRLAANYEEPAKMTSGCSRERKAASGKLGLLSSWKEIAVYLGRGVRTVQRWHAELGMPVQKMRPTPHSSVFAFAADVDAWLEQRAELTNALLTNLGIRREQALLQMIVKQHQQIKELTKQVNQLKASTSTLPVSTRPERRPLAA